MSGHGFTSAFATELDAYLAFKANMGFTGASRIWYLKQFDAYCAEHDRTVFDQDTVEGWVGVQLQRCGRYRSWMSYIRDVGRWMTMSGIPDAYVLSDRWKASIVAARPYVLSRHEIELFFAAAAQIKTQGSGGRQSRSSSLGYSVTLEPHTEAAQHQCTAHSPAPGHLEFSSEAGNSHGHHHLMTLDQLAPRYSDIFLLCSSVGTTGVPWIAGSASRSVLSTVPAFSIASARTGRARPFRKRF